MCSELRLLLHPWGSCALASALVVAVACIGTPARAEPPSNAPTETFRYLTPQRAHFGRAALEELVVLGGEMAQYWKDRNINSADWDLSYSWGSLRDKLDGTAYSFDTNRFPTNFAYHPAAGTLYYLAPRGNRASVLESLGVAFAASSAWEIFAEFRERVSINDMWVTPLSGLSLGETTTQLGAFFDRGCSTSWNKTLGFLFAPAKTLHDGLDGAVLARAPHCDAYGFDSTSEHRFRVSLGVAEVRAASGELYQSSRAHLETSIVNLPDDDESPGGWRHFSDGNVSELELGLAYGAGQLRDFLLDARATVAGIQYRPQSRANSRLSGGDRALFGVVVGTQYSLHRYLLRGDLDDVFLIDAPAVTVRWLGKRAGYGFELAFDVGATFGGMSALALPLYERDHGGDALTTIAKNQGYNYVLGVALVPRARLELEGAELGVSVRSERVDAIRAFDRYATSPGTGTAPTSELRRRGSMWIAVGPRTGMRLTLSVEAAERRGTIDGYSRELGELSLGLSLGAAL